MSKITTLTQSTITVRRVNGHPSTCSKCGKLCKVNDRVKTLKINHSRYSKIYHEKCMDSLYMENA